MKNKKADLISEREFTKIMMPKKKHHYSLPSEVVDDDENTDALQETLVGMEYDLESDEDIIDSEDEIIPDDDLKYLKSETEGKFD